jgi:protein ImuB
MPRLASLFLPDLATDRIRRAESPPERIRAALETRETTLPVRGGGWRPGARWAREAPPRPLALRSAEATGALVTAKREHNRDGIAAACPAARVLGLTPGMPLSKARILVSGLDVRPADEAGDAAWLARLGLFAARRWTPRAALSGPDGLWLDLSGVSHLFGGEKRMCARILAFLTRLGFTARIAVAGTTGAAHALARFGAEESTILCPPGGEAQAIAPMPLAALRLGEDALGAARRLGIEHVGALIAMPRAPLQRRFGASLLLRLDQALGRAPEPLDPIVPEDPPSVTLRFQEPIATVEAIEEAAGEAVRRIVPLLTEAGLAVRRLELLCERVDTVEQRVTVSTARATRDGIHLHRLLCATIATIEPGFGIERLRLIAARVEPRAAQPIEGALGGAKPAPDLALLIDRLAVRLGARRLFRLGALESDVPERSVARSGPLDAAPHWPDWPRPVRLLSPPEPVEQVLGLLPDGAPMRFRWRGKAYRVAAADGPERIYGEWWRRAAEAEAVRDYFQVEDADGARFWLYRRGDGVDPATGDLSWWMQGAFA